MKPILASTYIFTLLGIIASPLSNAESVEEHKVLKSKPDFGDAFRSDSTLRFMRRRDLRSPIQVAHPQVEQHQQQEEIARIKLCMNYGFQVSERAGCVAFMRQACHKKAAVADGRAVAPESCVHFFQEAQQQNPLSPFGSSIEDMQKGPQYNSKKAQKATEKVADKQEQAPARKPSPLDNVVDDVGDEMQDAQKGPNYHKKAPKNAAVSDKDAEEPEEKEVASVPGCRNSPKGWEDSKGHDCEDYAEGEWCTRRGGYGDAWLDEWGKFEDLANKGKTATQVCCVCGGGISKGEEAVAAGDAPVHEVKAGGAPAPASVSSPVPAVTGPILGTKKGRALQSQGYSGDLVVHEDQKTMTSDWGLEFGPHAGHRDIKTICAEQPGNEWCDLHGYYDKERSAASFKSSMAAVVAALLLVCLR